MSLLTLHLTLSGRPLIDRDIVLDGRDTSLRTDERGHLEVELPMGGYRGVVTHDGSELIFEFANAPGLRRVRIDLPGPEEPFDDPEAVAAMPGSRYAPLSLLGEGASGRVYKARDTTLDRLVAVKILHAEVASHEQAQKDFLDEARRLAQVDHANLIHIYDVGVHREQVYLVVQYVDGPNLDDLQTAEQRLHPASLAAAGVQLALGLNAMHEAGLVHRDVKPGNGLVDRQGSVRLADFGLVKPLLDLSDKQSRIAGTPAYMSPEQLRGSALGPAADIYSLGVALFEMGAGHPPFYEGDVMLAHLFDQPPDLREIRDEVPEGLAECLNDMMGKEPEERPDAEAVAQRLLPIAASAPDARHLPYWPRLPLALRLQVPREEQVEVQVESRWDDEDSWVIATTETLKRPPLPPREEPPSDEIMRVTLVEPPDAVTTPLPVSPPASPTSGNWEVDEAYAPTIEADPEPPPTAPSAWSRALPLSLGVLAGFAVTLLLMTWLAPV